MLQVKDDGYLDVTLEGSGDAKPIKVTLDLFRCYNRLQDLGNTLRDKPMHELHQAIVDFMKELGFPECSHRAADQFATGIADQVKLLTGVADAKKNESPPKSAESASPTPSSADSTEPAPLP